MVHRITVLTVGLALLAAAPAAAERYVALGDSYSSGVGTREYALDSACQRSTYAYPSIIDRERANTDLVFVACGGATTSSLMSSQIGSVTSAANIVTVTIGGNDAGFSNVIVECAKPWWAADCDGRIDTAQSFIRNTLPGRLDTVYSAIQSRAPSARRIALGYPRLFMGVDCNAGTWFSSAEMTRLNQTADLLRDVTRARAQAHGMTFLDAIPPFTGHAVCSSTEWINGLSNPTSESYHPNRTGQRSGYTAMVRSIIG